MASRVEGLQRLRQKVLDRFPKAARDVMREANEKSATEFESTVRRIAPKGDDLAPELLETLEKRPGDVEFGGLGVLVTIGGPQAPYPLHLEAGHKARDGSHVPPKPFWNPAKRVVSKRHKGRAARALRKAIQIATTGGGGA
jgi:hypothetical protein